MGRRPPSRGCEPHPARAATDHPRWQLPGGIAEEHESPAAAAERETREETALHLQAGALLVAAWTAARAPGRRDRLAFLFAGPHITHTDLHLIRPGPQRGRRLATGRPTCRSPPAPPVPGTTTPS